MSCLHILRSSLDLFSSSAQQAAGKVREVFVWNWTHCDLPWRAFCPPVVLYRLSVVVEDVERDWHSSQCDSVPWCSLVQTSTSQRCLGIDPPLSWASACSSGGRQARHALSASRPSMSGASCETPPPTLHHSLLVTHQSGEPRVHYRNFDSVWTISTTGIGTNQWLIQHKIWTILPSVLSP